MNCNIKQFFSSSIGKKYIMGLTGLALCGFLVTHLLGNLLLLMGPDAFNLYAHTLTSNPLIYVAEAILLLIFLSHLGLATKISLENRAARPVKYYAHHATGRGMTFSSKTMPLSGLVTFVFVVLHLLNFKYGTQYLTNVDGQEMRDVFKTVIEYFENPLYVVWYVFAMCVLGFHVCHGFQSAFQSLGFNHPKYTPLIKLKAKAFGLFVTIGFSGLAIWCHFQGGQ